MTLGTKQLNFQSLKLITKANHICFRKPNLTGSNQLRTPAEAGIFHVIFEEDERKTKREKSKEKNEKKNMDVTAPAGSCNI